MVSSQSEKTIRESRLILGLLPPLAIVVIHVLSGLQMQQPIILADELGYLGNARYLSGASHMPDLRGCQFYHFGYSLLMVPVFWLLSHPVAIYGAVLVLNAVLMGWLCLTLSSLLVTFFETPPVNARWIAFACCLYPSLLLYSSFALSENLFIPMYVFCAFLFGVLLQRGSPGSALSFGCAVGFLYTIHPRALPLVAGTVALLVLLAILRILPPSSALCSIGAIVAVVALTRAVNHHLNWIGWGGSGEYSVTKLAARVLPGSDFPALVERALGQILYLSLASHGIFLIGLAAMLWLLLKRARSGPLQRLLAEPMTGILVFVLLTSGGIFVASVTSKLFSLHGKFGVRGADIIHGRYNEAGAVLVVAIALSELCRSGVRGRVRTVGVMAVAVTMLVLTAIVMVEVVDAQRRHTPGAAEEIASTNVPAANVDPVNVPGVFPVIGVVGGLNLYWAAFVSIVILGLFAAVLQLSKRGAIAVLVLAFSVYSAWNHRFYRLAAEKRERPRLEFASIASRLGSIDELSYDTAFFDAKFFYAAQYLFPQTIFTRFSSRHGETPRSEAVISSDGWRQGGPLGARFVIAGGVCDNTLWLLPGKLQDCLPIASPEGVVLGSKPVQFVRESGFHQVESVGGVSGRWTDGLAMLHVPLNPQRPPSVLGIETMVPGGDGAGLRVAANGRTLMDGLIPPHRMTTTFPLNGLIQGDELVVTIESDTFSPAESAAGVEDSRSLGVFIVGVHVESHNSLAAAVLDGLTLGGEPVFGVGESGFYGRHRYKGAPARWTDGSATLHVPVDPSDPPRTLEIETIGPRKQPVQLRLLGNNTVLWEGEISLKGWKKTIDLDRVPMDDELLVELQSDTFYPPDIEEGSADTRNLGLLVRGIRLRR